MTPNLPEAAKLARPYVERCTRQTYDGTVGTFLRNKAIADLTALDAALSASAEPMEPVARKLIGWRTDDYLMETADPKMARNWSGHHTILPIFEGDAHTKLATPQAQAEPSAQEPDVPDIIAGALQCSRAYAYTLMERALAERNPQTSASVAASKPSLDAAMERWADRFAEMQDFKYATEVRVARTQAAPVAAAIQAQAEGASKGLRDALQTLVSLKDMKDRLTALHAQGRGTDYSDYRRLQPLAWDEARRVLAATPQPNPQSPEQAQAADYEEVLSDHRRLVRELDVLLNGEAGAATQASLCDIVSQVRGERIRSPSAVGAEVRANYVAALATPQPQPASPEQAQAQAKWVMPKRWPFIEAPMFFADRLERAHREFGGDWIAAVRHVLIERPPMISTEFAAPYVPTQAPAPSAPTQELTDERILSFAAHAADRIPANNYEGRVLHAVRMAEDAIRNPGVAK